MIKPNELRLGNYLIPKNGEGLIEVSAILKESIDWDGMTPLSYSTLLKGFKGIKLTPEWLEKFGFVNTFPREMYKKKYGIEIEPSGAYSYRLGDFVVWAILHKKDTWSVNLSPVNQGDIDEPVATVQYVHQLQNLFFCLNGLELLLK